MEKNGNVDRNIHKQDKNVNVEKEISIAELTCTCSTLQFYIQCHRPGLYPEPQKDLTLLGHSSVSSSPPHPPVPAQSLYWTAPCQAAPGARGAVAGGSLGLVQGS